MSALGPAWWDNIDWKRDWGLMLVWEYEGKACILRDNPITWRQLWYIVWAVLREGRPDIAWSWIRRKLFHGGW